MFRSLRDIEEFVRDFAEKVKLEDLTYHLNMRRVGGTITVLNSFSDLMYFGELRRKARVYNASDLATHYYSLGLGERKSLVRREFKEKFTQAVTGAGQRICNYPVRVDLYRGICPIGCIYCYAQSFAEFLLYRMFDKTPEGALKMADIDLYKIFRGEIPLKTRNGEVVKYMLMNGIPVKLGLRSEVFSSLDKKYELGLRFLKMVREHGGFEVIINTKTTMWWRDDRYRRIIEDIADRVFIALSITAPISMEERVKIVEPGAPPISERFKVLREYAEIGGYIVPWFVPPLVYWKNTSPTKLVDEYIENVKEHYPDSYPYKMIVFQQWRKSGVPPSQFAKLSATGFDSLSVRLVSSYPYLMTFRAWMIGRILNAGLMVAHNGMTLRTDNPMVCEGAEAVYYREKKFKPNRYGMNGFIDWLYSHPGVWIDYREFKGMYAPEVNLGEADRFMEWFIHVFTHLVPGVEFSDYCDERGYCLVRVTTRTDWDLLDTMGGRLLRFMVIHHPDYYNLYSENELVHPYVYDSKFFTVARTLEV